MFKTMSAITIALTGVCLAQPEAKTECPEGRCCAEQRQERRELRRDAMRDRAIERFDADGDGELSDTERASAKAAFQERREAHQARVLDKLQDQTFADLPEPIAIALSAFDLDDSQSIDDDERVLLEIEIEARIEAKKVEALAKFDADGDGELSQDERESARETRRAEHEQKRAEMLSAYDADGDGTLSKSERETLRTEEGMGDRDPLLEMLRPRRGHGARDGRPMRGKDAARGRFQRQG